MLLKYFYDKALAQASYLVGCEQTRRAIVIDPARDIRPYLQAARSEDLQITDVAETHIHADFVSGARELAACTGAQLLLSAEGGPDWHYTFAGENTRLLHGGDSFSVGTAHFDVLHAPGHTPEHLIYVLTDRSTADRPMGLFTGDVLFVGDIGRPDLLETAAGQSGTKEQGARQQFANIGRLKLLPDYLQVWPGHGAGSACGKSLGSVPSTTLGYEKLFNPAFQFEDEDRFVHWLLTDQPETPRYFGQMKRVNKQGPALLSSLAYPQRLEGFILPDCLKAGCLVIDARSDEEFRAGHVPGTLSIPPVDKFSAYAGEFVDYDNPTYLIAADEDVDHLIRDLRGIGVDNIPGYFPPDELGLNLMVLDTLEPDTVARHAGDFYILDVRTRQEYDRGHIPGAHHITLGEVEEHVAALPRDQQIVVQCGTGVRSQIIASFLQNRGFTRVANMRGGIEAWKEEGLPTRSA